MASSPDAPGRLSVDDQGDVTRIRIGEADCEVTGQHRYVLEYTLPEAIDNAEFGGGELALDLVGASDDRKPAGSLRW